MNDFVAQLLQLPVGVITMLVAIALGYTLKMAEFFPNKRIPLAILTVTTLLFPLLQFCADHMAGEVNIGWHIPLNCADGFLLGFAAWTCHAKFLRQWIDAKWFGDDEQNAGGNAPIPPQT